MGKDLRALSNLPEPLRTDSLAIGFKDGKLTLFIAAEGKVAGYLLDIIDGFHLSYLMLGATLKQLRDMGEETAAKAEMGKNIVSDAHMISRENLEKLLGDIPIDLDEEL